MLLKVLPKEWSEIHQLLLALSNEGVLLNAAPYRPGRILQVTWTANKNPNFIQHYFYFWTQQQNCAAVLWSGIIMSVRILEEKHVHGVLPVPIQLEQRRPVDDSGGLRGAAPRSLAPQVFVRVRKRCDARTKAAAGIAIKDEPGEETPWQ